jgi:hypothetical protein
MCPNPPGKFQAIHAGHCEIKNHCVRREGLKSVEHILTRLKYKSFMAKNSQEHSQAVTGIGVVIDDD